MMGIVWKFAAQALQGMPRITFGTEEHGPLIIVNTNDFVTMAAQMKAHL